MLLKQRLPRHPSQIPLIVPNSAFRRSSLVSAIVWLPQVAGGMLATFMAKLLRCSHASSLDTRLIVDVINAVVAAIMWMSCGAFYSPVSVLQHIVVVFDFFSMLFGVYLPYIHFQLEFGHSLYFSQCMCGYLCVGCLCICVSHSCLCARFFGPSVGF